jgi:hypothetical protein
LGRVWIGVREQVEHLRRLAVVFAVPIRLKIVTELYQRDMSPSQFHAEFGGGSLSRVCKHFERLEAAGWIRVVQVERPGGKRRGGRESIYRAEELPFCDRPTWIALPYSIRVTVGWNGFIEIARHVREAMEAHTFQSRPDHQLTSARIMLDEQGWNRVGTAFSEEFAAQYEEQEDARRRSVRSGEPLFRIGSLLMAFEMPSNGGQRVGPSLTTATQVPGIPFPVRLSKVYGDEVCMQIVEEANLGVTSVPSFYEEYGERFGLDEGAIRRRFTKLLKHGWLKVVEYKTGGKRRGGAEKIYRATIPEFYDEDLTRPWTNVPDELAGTDDWKTFARLTERVKSAMAAGTFNRRDDMCLAWSILNIDQEGWEKLVVSLNRLHTFVRREQKAARVRLKRSGEQPIPMVIAIGAFETPRPTREP